MEDRRTVFRRLGGLPRQGIAVRSQTHLCGAACRLVRTGHSELRRRRPDVEPGRERVRLRGGRGHASLVRRHAASVGVQVRLASGAGAVGSRHRVRRRRGRRVVPLDRRRPVVARVGRTAPSPDWTGVAAGRGRTLSPHDPVGPERPAADLHRHLRCRGVPERRRRHDLETGEPRVGLRGNPSRTGSRGGPLRPLHCVAPGAARGVVHAEALGRHAER